MSLPAVRNKMDVPEFKPGKEKPSLWSAAAANRHVAILRALVNPSVRWGASDKAELSDANFVIQLDETKANGGTVLVPFGLLDASNPDHFVCLRAAGTAIEGGGTSYVFDVEGLGATLVAKPYNLRQTPFDGKTVAVAVESLSGTTVRSFNYNYHSATYRTAEDQTDENPDNWRQEQQTIIPRFVPAVVEGATTGTAAPTIIWATHVSGIGITANNVAIEWLAQNDGWAWAESRA